MEIVKNPDKILRLIMKPVKNINSETLKLAEEMKTIMKTSNGVGLAANQVGVDLRVFVIDENLAKENNVPEVYINPEITEYSKDLAEMEEGCLSLPQYWKDIKRSKKIKFKATGIDGKKIKIKARGFLARVLQHEVDHLNGLLIKDRLNEK
jgi:peptide deformylase